jgi:dolichyl-phosphate-mannose-protein mannosyltransferase
MPLDELQRRGTDIPLASPTRRGERPVTRRWLAAPEPTRRRPEPAPVLLLAGLTFLTLVLRFYRLGDWNLQATEIFTLRDSVTPQFDNPRPLGYLLNYFLVRPFLPLDEFGLRLLPAIFGVLAVPAFYFVSRRLVGSRAALLGALLLAVSPLHILYSQLARYWSLVFLFSAIYPYAFFVGIRDRDRRALALALVTGVLAALAHPVSVLLVGGLGIWLLVTYMRPGFMSQPWNQKGIRWGVAVGIMVAAAIAMRFIPIFQGWISAHDNNPASGQFLLRPPAPPGLKQIFNIAAYAESLTLPLVVIALGGIYMLWRERDRSLAFLLICLAAFPILFLALASFRTPVSPYYLLPPASVFFIGAGVFLDRLFQIDWNPRWLLPGMVTAVVLAAGLPTMISDYRDGRRYPFRGAAHWLEVRLAPDDVVFSDQPMVLAHYLRGTKVERLRRPDPLMQSVRLLQQAGRGGALWIVAPAPSHAFRTNLRRDGLLNWILDNCQLRHTLGVGRVDFRQEYLQIYRCPSSGSPETKSGQDPTRPTGL